MGAGAAVIASDERTRPAAGGRRRGSKSGVFRRDARINVAEALKLRMGGMTGAAIAGAMGVSDQAVSQALTPFRSFLAAHDAGYHHVGRGENLDSGLDSALGLILENLNDSERMRTTDVRSLALSFDKLHLASRLRKGESTSNSELHVHVQGAMSGALDGASKRGKVDSSPDRCESAHRTDEVIDIDAQAALPAPSRMPPAHSVRSSRVGGQSVASGASVPRRSSTVAGAAFDLAAIYAGAVARVVAKSSNPRGKKPTSRRRPKPARVRASVPRGKLRE